MQNWPQLSRLNAFCFNGTLPLTSFDLPLQGTSPKTLIITSRPRSFRALQSSLRIEALGSTFCNCFVMSFCNVCLSCLRLSSFCIKCFHQARDYIAVDDAKIAQTMYWIIANQALNGSFAEPRNGRVIHQDMQVLVLTKLILCIKLDNSQRAE